MGDPGTAERWQALLLRDWQSATVIGLALALVVVFSALMRSHHVAAREAREGWALAVAHIEKNTAALAALREDVRELRPRGRGLRPPALGPEPISKVGQAPEGTG